MTVPIPQPASKAPRIPKIVWDLLFTLAIPVTLLASKLPFTEFNFSDALGTRTAFVLISHDRAFLRALTRATLWVDRGEVRRRESGFDGFEEWRETVWAEEDDARHKLDRKIKAEAKWAVEGISARRKRNQGRVRALADSGFRLAYSSR